jgi:hypothetical protein
MPQKLKKFRELVLSKTSRFWKDAKDIKISIAETLAQFARREDLIGWVRPSGQANMPALADELARLSRENAELRRQIPDTTSERMIEGLSFKEMRGILENKGLLYDLLNMRDDLRFRDVASRSPSTKKLEDLGLVKSNFSGPIEFTDSGRLFLNRLEAERLKAKPRQKQRLSGNT